MARRLRAGLASILAVSIVVLSPGLETPRLFAQVIGRAAPVQGVGTVPAFLGGAPAALPGSAPALMTAPSLTAPSAFTGMPSAALPAAAAPAATPAFAPASMPELAKALAPSLEAAAKPATSAAGAATAGRDIEAVITGAKSAGTGDVSAVAGSESADAPALSLNAAASAPSETPKSDVPAAAAPAEGKTVESAFSYRAHRLILAAVAAWTGAVNSLPIAGTALTKSLIASAADKRVVLSDYDDTLAAYNQVLPEDMVSAIAAVKAAGKDFVVISDRGDEKRAHQLTVFESLASLPVAARAGMFVAANSGGRVYRYDAQGEPVRVFEAPALDEASKAKVAEAAEATKARLKEIGAEQHFPSEGNNNPSESWGTYGYALMLKVGSSNEAVKGAAAILQDELAKRGMDVEVNPRFAKDPANPPYINFSIVTKAGSAAYIAKALKAEPQDVLVIGDSMYAPHDAKKASWLTALGEKLSGRAMPRTGNRTDANMERGVPGALTLSVGTTGDPRSANLFVLAGKGPSVTREVLMSVASKTRAQSKPGDGSGAMIVPVVAAVALVAASAAGFYAMFHAFADIVSMGEQMLMQHGRDAMEGGLFLGGVLGSAPKKASDGTPLWKRVLAGVGLVAATAAVYGGLYYAAAHAPAAVPDMPTAPGGWEMLFGGTLAGFFGMGRARAGDGKAARYAALEAGYSATLAKTAGAVSVKVKDGYNPYGRDDNRASGKVLEVLFTDLAAYHAAVDSLPKTLPAIDGLDDVSRYNVAPVLEKKAKAAAYAEIESGYKARLAEIPGVVSVRVKDSYHPYGSDDNRMSGKDVEVEFDGVTSLQDARAKGLLPEELPALAGLSDVAKYRVKAEVAEPDRWAGLKSAAATAGLIALTAAMYGAMYYAFTHAPAAQPSFVPPEGWQGPIPSNMDIGAIFGGTLGLVGLSGIVQRARKPKLSEERVRGAAASVASYKGRPWSHTEYNMAYYNALESLKKDGATKAQIALFEKLCAEAPIRGGSFNPWSGD